MKLKRFLANIVVLLIFAVIVFFIGWVQFRVEPGTCVIMRSKTSGLYKAPIESGVFLWRWEKLLPTNVSLETFNLSPYNEQCTISGELPSADVYSSFIENEESKIDFTYTVTLSVLLSATPQKIHTLVSENKIQNNDELTSYYSDIVKLLSSLVTDYLLKTSRVSLTAVSLTEREINEVLRGRENEFDGILVSQIDIDECKIPDIELYNTAKASYMSYLDTLDEKMQSVADEQAASFVEQDRNIEQLEKLGELMQKYPQLETLLQSENVSNIINAIRFAN